MFLKTLYRKIGEAKQWNYSKYDSFGLERGFPVIVFRNPMSGYHSKNSIFISFYCEDKEKIQKLIDTINERKDSLKSNILEGVISEYGMVILVNEFWKVLSVSRLQVILDATIPLLLNLGIHINKEFNIEPHEYSGFGALYDLFIGHS